MAKWTNVGSIRKSKDGKLYIKVATDVTLKKDSALQIQDPRKKLDESVTAGRLTPEKAEEMKNKIPDYIRYDIFNVTD